MDQPPLVTPPEPSLRFLPIVDLASASVYAHIPEAAPTTRVEVGHEGEAESAPQSQAADTDAWLRSSGLVLRRWGQMRERGRLFIPLDASALLSRHQALSPDSVVRLLNCWGLLARQVILLVTHVQAPQTLPELAHALEQLQHMGLRFALCDDGLGWPGLRDWVILRPSFVTMDTYFCQDVAQDTGKTQAVQALVQSATALGIELIARGVRTETDLRVLRDLDVPYAMGPVLGLASPKAAHMLAPSAQGVLADRQLAVVAPPAPKAGLNLFDRFQVVPAPTLSVEALCDDVADLFQAQPDLHAIALLQGDSPVALVNRMHFFNQYSKRYYRELWGRKPCLQFANQQPRRIELRHSMEDLLGILTSDDQRYLSDGFIVLDNGRYCGLCRGDQIVKSVTEMRIEAARHANPLTALPGNIPITQHIERLLGRGGAFVVAYLDLNFFKSFNDRYGYWRGDEMILLQAQVAKAHVQAQRDFLGHVGGDDFVIVFQDPEWETQCRQMIQDFNAQARLLFDTQDQAAGGIHSEDREGVARFFPLTSLSVGVVKVRVGQFKSAQDVANAAATAKHAAKRSTSGLALYSEGDL